jgi:hypothetical protein
VTTTKVGSLQSITNEDAEVEGAQQFNFPDARRGADTWSMEQPSNSGECLGSARHAFGNYWVKLHELCVLERDGLSEPHLLD